MSGVQFQQEQVDCFCFDNKIADSQVFGEEFSKEIGKPDSKSGFFSDFRKAGKNPLGRTSLRRDRLRNNVAKPNTGFEAVQHPRDARTASRIETEKSPQIIQVPIKLTNEPQTTDSDAKHFPSKNTQDQHLELFTRAKNFSELTFGMPPPNGKNQRQPSHVSPHSKVPEDSKMQGRPCYLPTRIAQMNNMKAQLRSPRKPFYSPRSGLFSKFDLSCSGMSQINSHREYKRLHAKEIESVMDEQEKMDDEMSEVIGRGWSERESDFLPAHTPAFSQKTETMGTSASNVMNSGVATSVLGVGEGFMRWA